MNKNHEKQIDTLLEKIDGADAICVGAAGMSVATGYDFAYHSDKYFKKYFGEFEKNMDFRAALTDTITALEQTKNVGHL